MQHTGRRVVKVGVCARLWTPVLHAARIVAVALFAAAGTGIPVVLAEEPPPDRGQLLDVHAGGRAVPGLTPGDWDYGWPGAYFEARFSGSAVDIHLSDYQSALAVLIDGQEVKRLDHPGAGVQEIRGLADGEHTIRLIKINESYSDHATFGGFYIPAGETPLPAPTRTRQIEFIGDSETLGLSNLSKRRQCEGSEIVDQTDTRLSFAARTAAHFDADYQIVAMSSRGLLRNYAGLDAPNNMQTYYERAFPYVADKVYQRPASWAPSVVVISLGTNDFSVGLQDGEPWADMDAFRAAYIDSYVAFVGRLRALDPGAYFVLTAKDGYAKEVQAVYDRLQASGEARVAFVHFTGLSLMACNYHPDVGDHASMASAIIAAIDAAGSVWASGGDPVVTGSTVPHAN